MNTTIQESSTITIVCAGVHGCMAALVVAGDASPICTQPEALQKQTLTIEFVPPDG